MTPRILDQRFVWGNEYLRVLEKRVDLGGDRGVEPFWAVRTGGYAAVVAITRDGLIPLVRQYRPAVDSYVLELPSGAIDEGEEPAAAARRELREETGCEARELTLLGRLHVDSGRLETRQWAFFASGVDVVDDQPTAEEELEVRFVSPSELRELLVSGQFDLAAHVAIVALASLSGRLEL